MNSYSRDKLRGAYNCRKFDDDNEDMHLEAMGQLIVVTLIVLTMMVAYIATVEGVGFWGVYCVWFDNKRYKRLFPCFVLSVLLTLGRSSTNWLVPF